MPPRDKITWDLRSPAPRGWTAQDGETPGAHAPYSGDRSSRRTHTDPRRGWRPQSALIQDSQIGDEGRADFPLVSGQISDAGKDLGIW